MGFYLKCRLLYEKYSLKIKTQKILGQTQKRENLHLKN